MLYTLHLHSIVWQFYHNKTQRRKLKQKKKKKEIKGHGKD